MLLEYNIVFLLITCNFEILSVGYKVQNTFTKYFLNWNILREVKAINFFHAWSQYRAWSESLTDGKQNYIFEFKESVSIISILQYMEETR